jgi:hypothetical protein
MHIQTGSPTVGVKVPCNTRQWNLFHFLTTQAKGEELTTLQETVLCSLLILAQGDARCYCS